MKTLMIALLAAASGLAQQLDLSTLEKLAAKAQGGANVSLDAQKLGMASQFLSGENPQDQKTKDLIKGLKGIFVRSFEFDKPGAYTQADLEPIRRQLKAPGWDKFIDVKDKDETAEVYFFNKDGQFGGLAVLAAEPNELVVVNIVGPIDIAALAKLSGTLGIPSLPTTKPQGKTPPPAKDDDDDDENN